MKLNGFLIASFGLFLGACGGGGNESAENDPFALEGEPLIVSFYDVVDNLTFAGEKYYYNNNVVVAVFEEGSDGTNNTIVYPSVDTSKFGFSGSYEGRWESGCVYQKFDDESDGSVRLYSDKYTYNFSGGFLTVDSEFYVGNIKCEGEAQYSSTTYKIENSVITNQGIENVDLYIDGVTHSSLENWYITFNEDGSQMLMYPTPNYYNVFEKIQ